jgi:cation diffusion facilitator CzcD-associated flavoprotein CzcO
MTSEALDVVIIGAGLSGIGAAVRLRQKLPRLKLAILESRSAIGGTWDLFRYPGIRSDSDMHTLGYPFRPWKAPRAIADGPSIRRYVEDTAHAFGLDAFIRFGSRVTSADWSDATRSWTLSVRTGETTHALQTRFVFACTGYYRYDKGFAPDFPGLADFGGMVVHPQFWPSELDTTGRHVAVIGSGATAVTLVPALAGKAAHVTMVQRTPTYIVARPSVDGFAETLKRTLPGSLASRLTRWKNIILGAYFFRLCRTQPARVRAAIDDQARKELGEAYRSADFSPPYDPWSQRLCLSPDGDFFEAIRERRASVATGAIVSFEPEGLRLEDGRLVPADIVVTATGLELQPLGGIALSVNGTPFDISKALTYRGFMYSGAPNLFSVFGYTNASWTLKSDLICQHVARLIRRMATKKLGVCTPRPADSEKGGRPWIDFSSGYVLRSLDRFPTQGQRDPWIMHQNYLRDIATLRFGALAPRELELR